MEELFVKVKLFVKNVILHWIYIPITSLSAICDMHCTSTRQTIESNNSEVLIFGDYNLPDGYMDHGLSIRCSEISGVMNVVQKIAFLNMFIITKTYV